MSARLLVGWLGVVVFGGVLAWGIWSRPYLLIPLAPPPPIPAVRPLAVATSTSVPPASPPIPTVEAQTATPEPSPIISVHAISSPLVAEPAPPEATPTSEPTEVEKDFSVSSVPILMYHYIRVNPVPSDIEGFNLSVTPRDFAEQVQWLANNGFHAVTMAEVRDFIRNGTPLPSKPIALTFDDGYDDAYSAARPVLAEHKMTGTFFIITGFVDHIHYLTWDQVTSLDQEGFEIGSHTVHHLGLPFLSSMLRRSELDDSRSTLEGHLGHSVLDFCYPSGEVDGPTEQATQQAGYLSATTTQSGFARRGDDPLRLPRLRIYGGMTLAQFAALLSGTARSHYSAPVSAKSVRTLSATSIPRPSPRPSPTRSPTPAHPASPTATAMAHPR